MYLPYFSVPTWPTFIDIYCSRFPMFFQGFKWWFRSILFLWELLKCKLWGQCGDSVAVVTVWLRSEKIWRPWCTGCTNCWESKTFDSSCISKKCCTTCMLHLFFCSMYCTLIHFRFTLDISFFEICIYDILYTMFTLQYTYCLYYILCFLPCTSFFSSCWPDIIKGHSRADSRVEHSHQQKSLCILAPLPSRWPRIYVHLG